MAKYLVIIAFLCAASSGHSGNVWIHAVGIDQSNISQNYDTFYQSAVAFNKECEQSSAKPTCFLFINDDPKLRPGTSSFNDSIRKNFGPTNSQNLKKTIADKIQQAKDGDTVIISLQNHGAPVDGQSPACIWLSSDDHICESDLAEILKSKPKGVKVLINADACFSGAFADLSSSEVCTATLANRLEFGYTNRRSFWNALSERHPSNLHDLGEPIVKESGQQRLLSSQVILQQLCRTARKKTSLDSVISSLSAEDSNTAGYDPSVCRDNDLTAKKVQTVAIQVLSVIRKMQSCQELELPVSVCEAEKRLKVKKAEIAKIMKDLEPIKAKEIDLNTWMTQNAASIPNMTGALNEQMKNLTPPEAKEMIDSLKVMKSPDWKKFRPERVNEIKKNWSVAEPLLSRYSQSSKNMMQVDEAVAKLKKLGVYDDLIMIQGCFYENNPQAFSADLNYYQSIGKKFPERNFTEKDYEKALKCEASVRF